MDKHPRNWTNLIRVWSVANSNDLIWRASVRDVHSSDVVSFADPASMIEFLDDETERLIRSMIP